MAFPPPAVQAPCAGQVPPPPPRSRPQNCFRRSRNKVPKLWLRETTLHYGRCQGEDLSVHPRWSASVHLCAPHPTPRPLSHRSQVHTCLGQLRPRPASLQAPNIDSLPRLPGRPEHRGEPAGSSRQSGCRLRHTRRTPTPSAAAGPSHTRPDARSHLSVLGTQNRLGARAGGSKVTIRVLASL